MEYVKEYKYTKYLPFVLIVFLTCFILIVISANNLGVSPDSTWYIEAAENIANGKGYVANGEHVTHWPPGYSILLGVSSKISGISVLNVGKYIQAVFYLLFGVSFKSILDEIGFNVMVKNFLIATILVSLPLTVSLYFWSELPFIFFISAAFLFYLRWKKNHNKSTLLIAGAFSVFALMTRYAAVGLLGGLFLNIILTKNRTFRQKISDVLLYVTPILFGISIWVYYTNLNSAPVASRTLELHIISVEKIYNSIKVFGSWFIGEKYSQIFFSVFGILSAYFIYRNKTRLLNFWHNARCAICELFVVVSSYILFLILSISLFDAHTPLDNRVLSPIAPFIYLLLGYFLNFLALNSSKLESVTMIVLMFLSSISSSKAIWVNQYKNGSGYTSKEYGHYFKIIEEYIAPYEGEIYTNGVDVLRFASANSVKAKSLPQKTFPVTMRLNENFNNEVVEMQTHVSQNTAQVVYFNKITWRWYLLDKEDLLSKMEKQKIVYFKDGFIIKSNLQKR